MRGRFNPIYSFSSPWALKCRLRDLKRSLSCQNRLIYILAGFFAPEYRPKINMSLTCVRHDGRLAKCINIFGRKKVIFRDAILGKKNNKTVCMVTVNR
jgi:hypothetical protein